MENKGQRKSICNRQFPAPAGFQAKGNALRPNVSHLPDLSGRIGPRRGLQAPNPAQCRMGRERPQTLYFWRALRTKSLVYVRARSTLSSAHSGCARDSTRSAVAGPSSGMAPWGE